MNCKPNELAIVVKSWSGNEGKIVRCLRIDLVRSGRESLGPDGAIFPPEPIWTIDPELPDFDGVFSDYCADSQLRPIPQQPDDAVDEMVQKLGKPEGVPA